MDSGNPRRNDAAGADEPASQSLINGIGVRRVSPSLTSQSALSSPRVLEFGPFGLNKVVC